MLYTLDTLIPLISAQSFGNSQNLPISWLLTDSRSLSFPESTLFFALHTTRNDGHRYIPELYRNGVRAFVVDALPTDYHQRYPQATFLKVASPLKALQDIATAHRNKFQIPVIGITGSNGKTIVKEWLNQILSPFYNITRSPRSYNSQIGVPLSVCLLSASTQMGLFEAGISQTGEMHTLEPIIQPTIGLLTNIGTAHQENFHQLEEKCLEKLKLFLHCKTIIYNADQKVVTRCIHHSNYSGELFSWSTEDPTATLYIRHIIKENQTTRIQYTFSHHNYEIEIPFIDDASIENAIHCLCLCTYLHLQQKAIAQRMRQLQTVAMRLEVKKGIRNSTLINDSYNSDVNSLDIALDFMKRRANGAHRKILLLSDIEQSGINERQLYKHVSEMVESRGIDLLIGIGEKISQYAELFTTPHLFFPSTNAFLHERVVDHFANDFILLKGARSFHFEDIEEQITLQVHETILEVNLTAIIDNLNYYRSLMQPSEKLVCMVKANAYGTGSTEVAHTLEEHGVDYLAVALADEGVALRKAGITSNIIIMNPEMSTFDTLFRYHLQPEVYNFRLLNALIQKAQSEGINHFPIHIKLDTGMHRLGFNPDTDLPRLIQTLQQQKALIIRSTFSHFVGSDDPQFDTFTQTQFTRFDHAAQQLQNAFEHKILRHICNSAGIQRFPHYHLDMCRLGLGLYGIDPINNRPLHNVLTLKTTILQIRDIPKDDTVGYSRKGHVDRPSRIAAIPIGYADGLNRHLGNRKGYCIIKGQKAHYIGNICMDITLVDVTNIDCQEGDSVEIFGNQLPVDILSHTLDTIPYEIFTSISERVKRVYYQE